MRIAAIQCPAIVDDVSTACETIVQHLRWADNEAIDLMLLPEAFLLGHSYHPETIRSRAHAAADFALAEVCRQVAPFRATLVVGTFVMQLPNVFNSAFVVERGRIVGRYAKAYPNEPGVTGGSDFPTFLRAGIRYGINICNDANHADAAEKIASQNADLILYPLNNMLPLETAERWRKKSLANLIDRARQTNCWIASSDVTGEVSGLLSYGCTAIIAPSGEVVARVPELSAGAAIYDVPRRQLSQTTG